MTALDLTAANISRTWTATKAAIVADHPKLSPALCGELAALRILSKVEQWAEQTHNRIDAAARAGESISDEDDARYIRAGVIGRELYPVLVRLSGWRPGSGAENMPEAIGPIVLEVKTDEN